MKVDGCSRWRQTGSQHNLCRSGPRDALPVLPVLQETTGAVQPPPVQGQAGCTARYL